jgi:hypothetical protein
VYGYRTPHVHPPHCPTLHARSNPDCRPPCTARARPPFMRLPAAYITSRAADGECAPPHTARCVSKNQHSNSPHPLPRRARPRTAGMLRVTDAPAPSCVGSRRSRCSAEGGVQVKVEEGVSSTCTVPHSSLLAVLGWVCVYGVTGCTADSSRVDAGGSVCSGAAPLLGTPRAPMGRQPSPPTRRCRQPVCASLGGSASEYWD